MISEAINQIKSALQIVIDFDASVEEIEYRWNLAKKISQHSKLFLEGRISGGDFLDLAETTEIDIDRYADEVEENLEKIGLFL
ncbi:hypothetical protein D0A34_23600 [Microcoleus vaginatus PCC 9802]|uniref:hypothetical protein n=1 Tax=Microcoleus vaginatus TaxID=119532 RepID=UPI00020D10AC|nr:hypothetical protein MicvaDRAFT_1765 [Microcoleus vaginatus FGP-2]UNU21431.1 hypothetical protein D0A34_23600 [Microcoleus vaginatus PCC 9802]